MQAALNIATALHPTWSAVRRAAENVESTKLAAADRQALAAADRQALADADRQALADAEHRVGGGGMSSQHVANSL